MNIYLLIYFPDISIKKQHSSIPTKFLAL